MAGQEVGEPVTTAASWYMLRCSSQVDGLAQAPLPRVFITFKQASVFWAGAASSAALSVGGE